MAKNLKTEAANTVAAARKFAALLTSPSAAWPEVCDNLNLFNSYSALAVAVENLDREIEEEREADVASLTAAVSEFMSAFRHSCVRFEPGPDAREGDRVAANQMNGALDRMEALLAMSPPEPVRDPDAVEKLILATDAYMDFFRANLGHYIAAPDAPDDVRVAVDEANRALADIDDALDALLDRDDDDEPAHTPRGCADCAPAEHTVAVEFMPLTGKWQTHCRGCGMAGPGRPDADGAITAWNVLQCSHD